TTGSHRDQSAAASVADGRGCSGTAESKGAPGRSPRAWIWDYRTEDCAQAAPLKSFDAGRPRAGFLECDLRVDRCFSQAFQSRCGVGRHRSRDREGQTSLAVPAKIRAQSEVGFIAINCSEGVCTLVRPVISHAFATRGSAGVVAGPNNPARTGRLMVLANLRGLRLQLAK